MSDNAKSGDHPVKNPDCSALQVPTDPYYANFKYDTANQKDNIGKFA